MKFPSKGSNNAPSNDQAAPVLGLPARALHEEFTGTTFIIFGPAVMTILQVEVFSKDQLPFA